MRAHIRIAHDGCQNLHHTLAVHIFHFLFVLGLCGGQAQSRFSVRVGDQFALVVHNGDVFGGHQRHAGRDQVNHGLNLRRADKTPRKRRDHHRRFGRRAVAHKNRLFGHGQVHAGRMNRVNLGDAARQLLLHGSGVAHLLHELAGGHGRLVFE